ncbi:MAG: DUF1080 domain-containing protein, partial [Bacteroidetes bacterium]
MKKIKIIISTIVVSALLISCAPQGEKKETEKETQKEVKTEVPALNILSQAEKDDGWVMLFDGITTKGWRGYGNENFPEKGWKVEDGTLHVMGSGKGEAGGGGDIITEKMYGNFELSLEWKVSEGGNSGIFYLVQEKPGQPIWKSAPEMQILDNAKHPDAKLGVEGNRAAGSLYDLIPGDFNVVNPAGEWNIVRVMVYKGTVVHWVNDKNVLEY